ncbi:MBL fold metallo-hydrolase [Thermogemmatispora carboxidivorans]|uniref:MBL fold metallo-hydrolase n=1 Tax=Thermogemmatispora carboxidivorans TaxID=1382306 RepID=UPI00069A4378|nr:MBL fold metallo-hydrolase [Thermogemmatispora carboxidivorans]
MTAISPGQEVPSRTAQKLRQVHTITDRFGMLNTYLIDDGGLVVVDPRSSLNGQLILYYIERFLQRSPTDIDLIVLTSLETNQSGGIETLRQRCRAPVAALSKTRSRASSTGEPGRGGAGPHSRMPSSFRTSELFSLDALFVLTTPHLRQVSIWLQDVGGLPRHEDWRVIATSGAAHGYFCLYNPFSWELIGGAAISTTEGGQPILHASSDLRGQQETLRVLRDLQIYYLYPGQGKPLLARNAAAQIRLDW